MNDTVETSFGTLRPGHFTPHDGHVRHQVFLGPKFLYTLFSPTDDLNIVSTTFLDYVRSGTLPFRRLIVNEHVIDEAATRLKRKASLRQAIRFLTAIEESEYIRFERVPDDAFDDARTKFVDWKDHTASFTDFIIISHMKYIDINHIVTYDSDFEAFEITTLPYLAVR